MFILKKEREQVKLPCENFRAEEKIDVVSFPKQSIPGFGPTSVFLV
jgi:hypothetical protein